MGLRRVRAGVEEEACVGKADLRCAEVLELKARDRAHGESPFRR
jgi:hypothetical protein